MNIHPCLFTVKEELRKNDNHQFLGCVAFLCQVFCVMRATDGKPFVPLVNPVLEVLSMCLDKSASEEEIICATSQVILL